MNQKKEQKKEQSIFKIKMRNMIRNNLSLLTFVLVLVLISFAIFINNNLGIKENSLNELFGDDLIEMHYFYLTTCPHCIEQKKFHSVLLEKYPNLKIIGYDMSNKASREKYLELANAQGLENPENIATPTTFIGNKSNVGFGTPETTGKILIEMIEVENKRILENWNNEIMKTTFEVRNTAIGSENK